MKRLLATMYWDIQLQWRNGFYYAAGVIVVMWVALLRQLPAESLAWLLPAFIANHLVVTAFFFIGGLVLLEKGEGTLEAQVVTPLRQQEYLLSKVITLTLLALAENGIIVLLAYRPGANVLALVGGTILAAALYALLGFIVVARYDSINEYLLPSMVYVGLFLLPLLPYVGVWQSPIFYLHPFQAPLLLIQAAFQPIAAWQIVYAILYGGLWLALMMRWSEQAFYRFVVVK